MRYAVNETPGGTSAPSPVDVHVDLEPGRAHRFDEARQLGEVGRGFVFGARVLAQHAEHAPDLGQRGAARRRDRLERLLRLGRVRVDHVRADAGLHRDHTHRVGDDVVQLLRDAQALVGDGALGFLVALALERRRRAASSCSMYSRRFRIVDPKKYAAAKIAMFAKRPAAFDPTAPKIPSSRKHSASTPSAQIRRSRAGAVRGDRVRADQQQQRQTIALEVARTRTISPAAEIRNTTSGARRRK